MPGRRDYSIILARAVTDARILRAAELYVEAGIAHEDTAHAAVLGHIAMLGVWASRESDTGELPGDGVAVVRASTITTPKVARAILAALSAPDVDLVTRDGNATGPLRLRGFAEAYAPLLVKREGNRVRSERWRNKQQRREPDVTRDVTRTQRVECGTRGPERTGEERIPPSPHDNGGGSSPSAPTANGNGHDHLSRPDAAVLAMLLKKFASKHPNGLFDTKPERERFDRIKAASNDPDEARKVIDEFTPQFLEEIRQLRITFAMADKQR